MYNSNLYYDEEEYWEYLMRMGQEIEKYESDGEIPSAETDKDGVFQEAIRRM